LKGVGYIPLNALMRNGNGVPPRTVWRVANSLYQGLERRTMRGPVAQVGKCGWMGE